MVRTQLLDPKRYFAERERLSVGRAGAVVVCFWVVSVVALTAFVQSLEPATGSLETSAASMYLTQSIIVAVYGVVALWLCLAVALHFLACWTGGQGRFFEALSIGGWAFAPPQLLAPVVVPIAISVGRTGVGQPDESGVAVFQGVRELIRSGAFDAVLAVLATWTIVLWAYGLEQRYELPFVRAVGCAAAVALAVVATVFVITLGFR
ncbi:YIP1 family protein [Natrononativus amylolyticus]|uniref:YIP1 family protein n=1 Tax=Natrononativus amylolyticus TaxID=2963434 RepID=UPI0020CE9E26|nr:YIP1 family protein [Natrononativus amylolyticus]